MSYFLYVVTSICLMTCQTALIPRLGFVEHFFDLLLPLVIYLAAFRPVHDTLPVVLFVGVLMDALSGGPFGIYLTSYVWLFIIVRMAAAVVRTENPMVLILILIIAVAFQNALFLLVIDLSEAAMHSTGDRIRAVSEQIGWVLLTGPLLALGIRQTRRVVRRRTRTMTANPVASEP